METGRELYLEGKIRDVMTPQPICVREDDDLEKVVRIFVDKRFHGFPVLNRQGKLVGLLRDSDLLSIFARRDPASRVYRRVGDIMQSPPPVIGPDESIQSAIMKTFADQTRILVVVDREGKVAGIVTRIDLIKGIRFREMEG